MKGFYHIQKPVDGSYIDHLVITIAMPHGSTELTRQISQELTFMLGKIGIIHSGHLDAAESLKHHQSKQG